MGHLEKSDTLSQGSLGWQPDIFIIDAPRSPTVPLSRKSSGSPGSRKSLARCSCELGTNSPDGLNAALSPMHGGRPEAMVNADTRAQLPKCTLRSDTRHSEVCTHGGA
eukprot:CAMPEP_0177282418 /NCGR_PEP_ID=MMETSP0367-20130122/71449_1 /TAXON_ID=447022 ORGANISM="Scrippsiella hangoei-like, Strain SHHI-4" /NCGR_SAMPLE_ID=MMETSP0367 /ASSEMBLY_ACC=CAM_ASM_000362 /LENGTH=107 /DNA_ID=CAMNT_0018739337 /DNA_START=29 /DNA_END=352 /DNA_ORIENTATION=-